MYRFLVCHDQNIIGENQSTAPSETPQHTLFSRETLPARSILRFLFDKLESAFDRPKALAKRFQLRERRNFERPNLPLRNPLLGLRSSLHKITRSGPLMMSFEQFLQNVSYDPLVAARQHVATGGRAIGFVGPDIPVELILAADAFPLQLCTDPDGNTPLADQHFEPSFSELAKSIAEQWLSGKLDFLNSIVFSRASDSIQRCYYYLSDLHNSGHSRAPKPHIFDVAKIPRATSVSHTHRAILSLAKALSAAPNRLPEAVTLRDRRRALMARLAAARRSPEAPGGVISSKLLQIADSVPANELDRQIEAWLGQTHPTQLGPRVLLAGSAPTGSWIHEAVEVADGCVVSEIGEHAIERFGPPIGPSANPSYALAEHYHRLNSSARSFDDPADRITRSAIEYRVDGAVLWLTEEDEALPWQLPALTGALNRLNIPALILCRQRRSDQCNAASQISRFVSGLGGH